MYDNARTGESVNESILTPANVNRAHFGKVFTYATDGLTYAQPLYVASVSIPGKGTFNVLYIVTEHDSVYAFDADGKTTAPLWQVSFLGDGATIVPTSLIGNQDLGDEVGITSTPVIDPGTGIMYVVAFTLEGGKLVYRLHALDIATGADRIPAAIIQATVKGTGAGNDSNGNILFNPKVQMQRPGLLLWNGVIYVGFGSFADLPGYHGWIMGYNASTLQQTAVHNMTANGNAGSIWQSGCGISTDGSSLFFITANGDFDNSFVNLSDSFVRMDATLNVTDFFAPYNEGALDAAGLDMGTSGALLLPDQAGSHPQMMVGTNKNGDVYLVDRNNLGHWNSDNNGNIVQYLPRALGNNPNRNQAYGCAAYWNGNVYFVGAVDTLKQFSLSGGLLSSGPVFQSATVISNVRGATPVVSASGTANGIVWVTSTTGAIGSNAVLHAYLATNVGTELYNSNENPNDTAGTIVKFTPPLVVNGRVYVAGANGVWVYGLLP